MRRRCIASVTSLCLLLLALGGPLFAAQAGVAQPDEPYKLRAGDRLDIIVFPQGMIFNRTLVVGPDGRIYYPVVGEILAAGKTVPQVTAIITEGLKNELRNYRVTVSVEPRAVPPGVDPARPGGRVTILGAVRGPAVVTLQENMRLIEALGTVGGPSDVADLTRVTITRGDLTTVVVDLTSPTGSNFVLQAGDTVVVPDVQQAGLTASALGEVMKPGPVTFAPGATLLDLLKEVGGPTLRAGLRGAVLRRVGQPEPLPIDLEQLWLRGDLSLNLRLVQGDVLVVPDVTLNVVYLYGAVAKPDAIPLRGGERLIDILIKGGQIGENAQLAKVTVTRLNPDGTRLSQKVDLKKLQRSGDVTAATMPMMPGDIVIVPSRPLSAGQDKMQKFTQIVSLLSVLTSLQSLFGRGNQGGGRRFNDRSTVIVR